LGTSTELRAQRNYAGHRLAPWLSHVMVSRQETARPLLTPGEVMQLPPADELVLVSGLAPIKAKKLRYYEDRNFMGRALPAPPLSEQGYPDCPPPRPNDWSGHVRRVHIDLSRPLDREFGPAADGGDLERQPWTPDEKQPAPQHGNDIEHALADDDPDTTRIEKVRSVARAHAMNEGDLHRQPSRDLLPEF
jgi:type IV secretion system protein VirD4